MPYFESVVRLCNVYHYYNSQILYNDSLSHMTQTHPHDDESATSRVKGVGKWRRTPPPAWPLSNAKKMKPKCKGISDCASIWRYLPCYQFAATSSQKKLTAEPFQASKLDTTDPSQPGNPWVQSLTYRPKACRPRHPETIHWYLQRPS